MQLVDSAEDRQVYSQLLADEHPRGAVCHAGRQLRYLVRCDEGLVGAIGFAAAALALADRDPWIGWDPPTRRQQLDRVLGLSRFLIREVHCRNLASKVLALCLRRLPDDFRQRYGFAPLLLETFVDPVTHDGACFKAANWTAVGRTAGRGRFAPADAPRRSRKLIFVRPLRPDWRERLGVPDPRIPAPVEPADGLDRDRWAALEFGGAPLGDARLARRLVTCATLQAEAPMDSFPGAAQGARALVKGWYRFLDHPAGVGFERGEHPGPAPRAHAGPHAGAGRGALRAGRHGSQLRRARRLHRPGEHRQEQALGRLARAAPALDAGGQRGGPAAGRAAHGVRRAGRLGEPGPGPGERGGEGSDDERPARERSRSERSGGERSRGERSGGEGARGERPGAEGSGGEGPVPEGQAAGRTQDAALGARGCATARRWPRGCPARGWCR